MIGAIANIVSGAISAFNKVLDMFRDKQLRDQGATDQKLSDTQQVLSNVDKANRASDDPDITKRVSDKYGR